jgi:intracellular sulfur oxidation DsrE/DsrF family protein
MKNIANVQKAFGPENVEIELVVHGRALHMVRSDNPDRTDFVRSELQRFYERGVVVAVCRNSMQSRNVSRDEIFPFTVVVDAALAEIIRKQEEGWAFLKLGW